MMFQRWMRYGVLSSALLAIPVQNAFAFGAQWRPVNSVSPAGHSVEARMQRSAAHARFRPANHLRQPQPLQQLAAPMVPPPPVRPMRPVAPQPPAFARQFSWHPAPTLWTRHERAGSDRRVRNVSSGSHSSGAHAEAWRPVGGVVTATGRVAENSHTYVPQGAWRPVAAHPVAPRPVYSYQVPVAPTAYPYSMQPLYEPQNPYLNGYPAQPYMLPPMPMPMPMPMAGRFNPYPMPHLTAPFAPPYPGYRPMMPPPPPAWGWQPPVYMPMRPRYAPPPLPPLNNESSLAGCPGC